MRKLAILLSIPVLLLSCGNNEEGKSIEELIENENLAEIRAKKNELSKEQSGHIFSRDGVIAGLEVYFEPGSFLI